MEENSNELKITRQVTEDYQPISMWGYFGYEILFMIPVVGFILTLVFSFGGTQNVNLKNYARSKFCLIILGIVFIGICFFTIGFGVLFTLLNEMIRMR